MTSPRPFPRRPLVDACALACVLLLAARSALQCAALAHAPWHWFRAAWGIAGLAAVLLAVAHARRPQDHGAFALRLALLAFAAFFTAHGSFTSASELHARSLERPSFLPHVLLAAQAVLCAWLALAREGSWADRALLVLIVFHAFNRDLYGAESDGIALLAGLAVLRALQEDGGRAWLPPRAIGLPLVAFLLLVAASVAAAGRPERAWTAAAYTGAAVATGWLIAARAADPARLLRPLLALAGAGALVVAVAALTVVTAARFLPLPLVLADRLQLLHQYPNVVGAYLAALVVLCLALRPLLSPWPRRALLLLAVVAGLELLLTGSRTAWAGAAAGSAAWAWSGRPPTTSRRRRVLGSCIAVGIVLALAGAAWIVRSDPTRAARAIEFRADAWRYAASLILQQPWLGVGPDTFPALQESAEASRFARTVSVPHPHNAWLYVVVCCGIPAGLALLGVFLAYGRGVLRLLHHDAGPARSLARLCTGVSVALLTCGLADVSLGFTTLLSRTHWVLLGIAAALLRPAGAPLRAGPALALAALLFGAWFGVRPALARMLDDRAAVLERTGDDAAATRMVEWSLHLDPHLGAAHERLVRLLVQQGRRAEALARVEAGAARAPLEPDRILQLGSLRLLMKDVAGAVAALRAAVEQGRGAANRSIYAATLVRALLHGGRHAEARAELAAAIRRDVHVLGVLKAEHGRVAAGGATLELRPVLHAIEQELEDRARGGGAPDRYLWWNLYHAHRLAGLGRLDALLDRMLEVLGAAPAERAEVHFQRSLLRERDGALDVALGEARAAADLGDPSSRAAPILYRARCLRLEPGDPAARARRMLDLAATLPGYRQQGEVLVAVLEDALHVLGPDGDPALRARLRRMLAFLNGPGEAPGTGAR